MENIVNFRILYLISVGLLAVSGPHLSHAKPSGSAVMLEIIDGDTAFVVDETNNAAWWVVGQCRRPIPVLPQNTSQNKSIKTMTSKIIRNNTRIGNRQIVLKQQFRFTLADAPNGPITVEVYNSLRGGWSVVPVRQKAQCAYDATCRQRMEAPEC
ncbi:MAG: hypothetical protein COA91_05070 [Robiginitomaculum sp.]|nr:MAG: hypothetical protein COA91_05070 [Robiginitomaculum sp.]